LGFFIISLFFSLMFPVLKDNPQFQRSSFYENSSLYAGETSANSSKFTQYEIDRDQRYEGYVSGVQGIYNNQSVEEPQKGTERGAVESIRFTQALTMDILSDDIGLSENPAGRSILQFLGALTGIIVTVAFLSAYFARRYT